MFQLQPVLSQSLKLITFLIVSAFFVTPSFSGGFAGGGGDIIYCPTTKKWHFIDFVYPTFLSDDNIGFPKELEKSKDPSAVIKQIITLLEDRNPALASSLLDFYMTRFISSPNRHWVQGGELRNDILKDENIITKLKHCLGESSPEDLIWNQAVIRDDKGLPIKYNTYQPSNSSANMGMRLYDKLVDTLDATKYSPNIVLDGMVYYSYDESDILKIKESSPVEYSMVIVHEWLRDFTNDTEIVREANRELHTRFLKSKKLDKFISFIKNIPKLDLRLGSPLGEEYSPNGADALITLKNALRDSYLKNNVYVEKYKDNPGYNAYFRKALSPLLTEFSRFQTPLINHQVNTSKNNYPPALPIKIKFRKKLQDMIQQAEVLSKILAVEEVFYYRSYSKGQINEILKEEVFNYGDFPQNSYSDYNISDLKHPEKLYIQKNRNSFTSQLTSIYQLLKDIERELLSYEFSGKYPAAKEYSVARSSFNRLVYTLNSIINRYSIYFTPSQLKRMNIKYITESEYYIVQPKFHELPYESFEYLGLFSRNGFYLKIFPTNGLSSL